MAAGAERHRAALALAFLAVGANGLATIGGDTLFVTVFSLGDLSRFVGIAALVRVASSFLYAALAEKLLGRDPSPARAGKLDAVVIAITATACALCAVASVTSDRRVIYAVCLAQVVLPPILPLIAFNTIASALRARDAKRVLPLVAAAATVGSIAVGAVATVIAKVAGVYAILGLSGLMAAAAVPLCVRVAAASDVAAPSLPAPASKTEAGGPATSLRDAVLDIRDVPAVRVVVAFAFFGAIATSFVDYAFKASLKETYGQQDVAAALGVFSVVANAVVLALQLGVTGPLVARLGVGRTLAASPSVLGVATLAAFALPAVVGTGVARLAEVVVRYGVGNSIADVLLVPLARGIRMRAKVLVKGAASPLGALVAGGALAMFGEAGPSRTTQLVLLAIGCALLLFSVRRAPDAYAKALASALARGRGAFDITPEAALVFRSAVRRQLEEAVRRGELEAARTTLEIMSDRFCMMEDTRPAFATKDVATKVVAVETAARLAGPKQGPALLSLVMADADAKVELAVLTHAREREGLGDDARLDRAVATGAAEDATEDAIELWAEGLVQQALRGKEAGAAGQPRLDRALKQLRKAALGADGPRRVAALSAIGALGDRRAEREVQMAMGSHDPRVFRAAAQSAIQIDASGAVASLVARLVAGPHPAISAHALALAGPRAVRELIHALPVSRGEGAIAPTAVAEGRTVSGTVRAARALARIGEGATRGVLPVFGDLGHRARVAVARAFAAHGLRASAEERPLVETAVSKLIAYGRSLKLHGDGQSGAGLLPKELRRRIEDTVGAIFDLATTLGDRDALQRARFATLGGSGGRDNALELVETVLPAPLGPEAARFIGDAFEPQASAAAPSKDRAPALDGWLEKCRKYDARELPLTDPMLSVLDKVLVLRDVPLFRGLSGEDLYPVAEIASVEAIDAGATVVRQGDPSDDLYVVLEGDLAVEKDGKEVGALDKGKTFGELGVLDGEPRAATVAARSGCKLLRIPRSELEALLDESPELAKGIIRTLLGYVRGGGSPTSRAASVLPPVPSASKEQ